MSRALRWGFVETVLYQEERVSESGRGPGQGYKYEWQAEGDDVREGIKVSMVRQDVGVVGGLRPRLYAHPSRRGKLNAATQGGQG